jgi:hypothetical protein
MTTTPKPKRTRLRGTSYHRLLTGRDDGTPQPFSVKMFHLARRWEIDPDGWCSSCHRYITESIDEWSHTQSPEHRAAVAQLHSNDRDGYIFFR